MKNKVYIDYNYCGVYWSIEDIRRNANLLRRILKEVSDSVILKLANNEITIEKIINSVFENEDNEKAKDVFKVGDEHKFVVVETRKDENKVLLGYKQLKDDPRKKLYAKYHIGQKYDGEVVKMFNYGVVVKLEDNVTGFLHISDAEYGLINMQEAYKLGDNISVKIKEIDLEKNKISLERKYDYEYELD